VITARHLDRYRFELRVGAHSAVSDQRLEYGGEDTGPMPSELLLWSVASCFGQALVHVAGKMRVPLPELTLRVGGEKDPEAFRFRKVTVEVQAASPQARVERAVELARKYCFVTNSLDGRVALEFLARGEP
jgi:uncharacterized OsmC-like protein